MKKQSNLCFLLPSALASSLALALLWVALPALQGQEAKLPEAAGKAPTADLLPGKGPAQKGDWFDKVWTQRRAEFRANKAASKGALVFLGDASKQRPADKIQKLNALVDDLVKGDARFLRCDTWSIFADANGNAKQEESPDLLHPNATGYAKWVQALQPILAKLDLPTARKD